MATLGDFGSLLQLGVGLGLGLSVFRAPLDVRLRRIGNKLQAEMDIVQGVDSEFSRDRVSQISRIKIKFLRATLSLEQAQFNFSVVALIGALLNVLFLTVAAVQVEQELSMGWQIAIIFISWVYFVFLIGIADVFVRFKLRHLEEEIRLL